MGLVGTVSGMGLPITIVDAFTDQPFAGNPAAVVVLPEPAPAAWMQAVAAEVNLAETAFTCPRPDGDHDLRWFTPTVEVDLCGHATLATAHVLGGDRRFHTRSGVLVTTVLDDGTIAIDLPAAAVEPCGDDGWAAALQLPADAVIGTYAGKGWVLVELASAADVEQATPIRDLVLSLGGHAVVAADATAVEAIAFDSVCRTFVPGSGIDEDPVTGAAHCVLAPWLADRTGRDRFLGRQASSRGGTVSMLVHGDRVQLSGPAVTVSTGELLVGPA